MKNTSFFFREIVRLQKEGIPRGICSICSANSFVIEAALEQALNDDRPVLIESTCNQVNQFGGYTAMTPQDFVKYVYDIAISINFPLKRIIFGGDHLGPHPWKGEHSRAAMKKACELVKQYVSAGFTKIHIDASMHLADDPGDRTLPLDPALVAERDANICSVAEESSGEDLVYVIGTEVPTPGGTLNVLESPLITEVSDFKETIELSQEAFIKKGLSDAWKQVIAVVVQLGAEFGSHTIHEFQPEKTRKLCNALKEFPDFVFEAHSTDYQMETCLKQMVENGIAILKVGPCLTFTMREAIFLLCYIEKELLKIHLGFQASNLIEALDDAMMKNPVHWENYYHGSDEELQFARKYSFSDRSRYYWSNPNVQRALCLLFSNLEVLGIPLTLISQFFPKQYSKIRNGSLKNTPKSLIKDKVNDILKVYSYAVTP